MGHIRGSMSHKSISRPLFIRDVDSFEVSDGVEEGRPVGVVSWSTVKRGTAGRKGKVLTDEDGRRRFRCGDGKGERESGEERDGKGKEYEEVEGEGEVHLGCGENRKDERMEWVESDG